MSSGRWKKEGCRNSRNRFQRLSFPAGPGIRGGIDMSIHESLFSSVFFFTKLRFLNKKNAVLNKKKWFWFFCSQKLFNREKKNEKKVQDCELIHVKCCGLLRKPEHYYSLYQSGSTLWFIGDLAGTFEQKLT